MKFWCFTLPRMKDYAPWTFNLTFESECAHVYPAAGKKSWVDTIPKARDPNTTQPHIVTIVHTKYSDLHLRVFQDLIKIYYQKRLII